MGKTQMDENKGCSAEAAAWGVSFLMLLFLVGMGLIGLSRFQSYTSLDNEPTGFIWMVDFDKEEIGFDYLHIWESYGKQSRSVATIKNGKQISVIRVTDDAAKVKVDGNIGWISLEYLRKVETK